MTDANDGSLFKNRIDAKCQRKKLILIVEFSYAW